MPGAARLYEFAFAALLIELTPGPNMTYLAALALTRGAAVGMAAVAGVAVGLTGLGLAATLGLVELFETWPTLYTLVRAAGAAFMLWLAWDAWRGSEGESQPSSAALGSFGRGIVSNLLNPKAALFYLVVPPQFIDDGRGPTRQLLTLVAVYVAVATFVHASIVVSAATLRSGMKLHAPGAIRLRKAMAVALALVAFWFLWETRR